MTDLVPVADNGTTGTTVHFRPTRPEISELKLDAWPHLSVETS